MTLNDLIELENLSRVRRAAMPSIEDLQDLLWNAELVDVRWQPWRASLALLLRRGDDLGVPGDFGFVLCRGVSRFAYSAKGRLIVPGFRSVGLLALGTNEGGELQVSFELARDEQVSLGCVGAAILTGTAFKEGQPEEYPDYAEMTEAHLATLQQSWDYEFTPASFTTVGQWP